MVDVSSTGNSVVLTVGGTLLLGVLILLGALLGWRWGVRSFLTVTLASVVGYLLFVDGGAQLLGYFNNIFTNLPKLFAILLGNDPNTAPSWPPLVVGIQVPLFLRVIFFIIFVVVAMRFNTQQPWYAKEPRQPFARETGAFTGALTALIWVSAVTTFWVIYVNEQGTLSGLFSPLNSVLGTLPDVSGYVPLFILAFVLFLVMSLVLKLPKLLKP